MDEHGTRLPDPKYSARALVLDCRVPPAGQMNGVVCACEGEADSASLGGKDHHAEALRSGLESIDSGLARPHQPYHLPALEELEAHIERAYGA